MLTLVGLVPLLRCISEAMAGLPPAVGEDARALGWAAAHSPRASSCGACPAAVSASVDAPLKGGRAHSDLPQNGVQGRERFYCPDSGSDGISIRGSTDSRGTRKHGC